MVRHGNARLPTIMPAHPLATRIVPACFDETKPILSDRSSMSSLKQIEANRRNALKSTGPITPEGKERSRCNAFATASPLRPSLRRSRMQRTTRPSKPR